MTPAREIEKDSEFLWFDERTSEQKIREEIEKNVRTVRRLHVQNVTFLNNGGLDGLELPNLTELLVESLNPLDTPSGWAFLHKLESLESLVSGTVMANDSILTGLAEAPWWSQLTTLDLSIHSQDKTASWSRLWTGKRLSIELMCLRYLTAEQACEVLSAKLKNLTYLILGITKGAPWLEQLAVAELPNLEDLELRYADISEEIVVQFIQAEYPAMPKLRRIGKNFYSDRKYDVCDWNGAVVDWGYEQLSDREIQKQIFSKTKFFILPSNSELEGRSPSGWLRPLQRVPN